MEIKKDELEYLYRNNRNKDVCNKLNISHPTYISLLKRAGIETKGRGNKYPRKLKINIKY